MDLYVCQSGFGWMMVTEASNAREAEARGNANVGSFGGIVGVDHVRVRRATDADVAWYCGMGGCTSSNMEQA